MTTDQPSQPHQSGPAHAKIWHGGKHYCFADGQEWPCETWQKEQAKAETQPSQPPLDEAAIRTKRRTTANERMVQEAQSLIDALAAERESHEQTRRELSRLTINHRKQIDSTADAAVKNMRLKKRLRAAEATVAEWRRRAERLLRILDAMMFGAVLPESWFAERDAAMAIVRAALEIEA